MKPVIKAKRWWWLPDRKKAKLLNQIQQHQMNLIRQQEIDAHRKRLYGE